MAVAFYELVDTALGIYMWLIILGAILSWLVAFNVVNSYNQFVSTVMTFLYRISEPALRPIRRILPDLGGIDISPIILLLLIAFARRIWFALFFG